MAMGKIKTYLKESEHTKLRLFGTAAVLTCIVMTCYVWFVAVHANINSAKQNFNTVIREDAKQLGNYLNADAEILYSGRSFLNSGVNVTRASWNTFYNNQNIQSLYPGVYGAYYITRISSSQQSVMANYLNSQAFPGESQFSISPASTTPNSDLAVVTYAAPSSISQHMIGFNVFSDPATKSIFSSIADNNEPVATYPLTNATGQKNATKSILIALPVANFSLSPNLTAGNSSTSGYVAILVRLKPLFDFIFKPISAYGKIGVTVDDNQQQIYKLDNSFTGKQLTKTTKVDIAGQTWTMHFSAPGNFGLSTISKIAPYSALGRGFILIVLILIMFYYAISLKVEKAKSKPHEAKSV